MEVWSRGGWWAGQREEGQSREKSQVSELKHTLVNFSSWMLSLQLCLTVQPYGLWPPGSCVHGILQARILEWFAISSSGDLPDPKIEPDSLTSSALANQLFSSSGTWEALRLLNSYQKTEIPGRNKKKVQLKRSTYPKQHWGYFGVRTHKPHCEQRINTGFSFPHLPVHQKTGMPCFKHGEHGTRGINSLGIIQFTQEN